MGIPFGETGHIYQKITIPSSIFQSSKWVAQTSFGREWCLGERWVQSWVWECWQIGGSWKVLPRNPEKVGLARDRGRNVLMCLWEQDLYHVNKIVWSEPYSCTINVWIGVSAQIHSFSIYLFISCLWRGHSYLLRPWSNVFCMLPCW